MSRPLTRLRIVLASGASAAEALAARVADALAVHGVQVRQQVQIAGAQPDGAPRADVALWLPDVDGRTGAPDGRLAPARVHAALVVEPPSSEGGTGPGTARAMARFDALVVPHVGLRDVVRAGLRRTSSREVPIVVARLPGAPLVQREAEKALRGVAGRRVVVVDVRPGPAGEDVDLERLVVQLALKSHEGALVLLAPHDERSRARVRSLCERHAVDAWLASGADAFAHSVTACDLFVGRPTWDELALAALHQVAVAALAVEGKGALVDSLRGTKGGGRIDDVTSTLQLAAAIDRRLADPGSLDTRGIALRDALFGPDQELIDALASLEPLPQGAAAAAVWEPIGPHAADAPREAGRVEARDAASPAPHGASPSRAQKIEDELEALRQKMTGGT